MTLAERIKTILNEKNISQREFAKTIGVTPNYINLLINGKKLVISNSLALLIEQLYGYSAQWVLNEEGEKQINTDNNLLLSELISKIKKMSDTEVYSTLAFINSLDEIYKNYKNKNN